MVLRSVFDTISKVKSYHFVFQKLVRDNLKEVFSQKGITSFSHQLAGEAYCQALKAKLLEEAEELASADASKDLINEIADIQEVLEALIQTYELSPQEIAAHRQQKKEAYGGFQDGLYIESIQVPEGHADLAYYHAHPEKYPPLKESRET